MVNSERKDFSIIFKEIERFHTGNPANNDNGINEEDILNNEVIRKFNDLCREINNSDDKPVDYLTFP